MRFGDPPGGRDHGRPGPPGGPGGHPEPAIDRPSVDPPPLGPRTGGPMTGLATPAYDAIVVGGGHNGLVAGALLARAGLRTLILEQRPTVGGQAVTDELRPGVRVPTLAHTVGRLRPDVAATLGLAERGLALVQSEARAFLPLPDGRALTLWA
ncbi:MAG: FAD-dependent oxidoreductase, partial [Chloroflexota bacterium]